MDQYSEIFFICDPEKQPKCRKAYCKALGKGECNLTTHPEYAKTGKDGQPKRAKAEPADPRRLLYVRRSNMRSDA